MEQNLNVDGTMVIYLQRTVQMLRTFPNMKQAILFGMGLVINFAGNSTTRAYPVKFSYSEMAEDFMHVGNDIRAAVQIETGKSVAELEEENSKQILLGL